MSKLNQNAIRMVDIAVSATQPGAQIPYILQAEPFQPSDISSISLPAILIESYGGPLGIPISAGQQFRVSAPNIVLLVARIEANTDLKYGIENLYDWGDAITQTFAQHVRLSAPAKIITGATNASPIVITTATPHRYNTGDAVTVNGVLGNTAANGPWIVTVIDYLNFSLNSSAGNGTYTSGSGSAILTQPDDMVDHVVDFVLKQYKIVPYQYGSTMFLALSFASVLREMYVTTIRS